MTLNSKEIKLLERIKEDKSYSVWFFREAKHLKWYFPLKDQGYFSPSEIDFDEHDNALFWDILDYLERVSEQVKDHNEYGKELLDIIKETVSYSNQRLRINNYHIWWYFVKIINNLPPEIIIENLSIDDQKENEKTQYGFRSLLHAMTDPSLGSDLAATDVSRKLLPKFLEGDYLATYAETIIDVITSIRPKPDAKHYFNRGEAELVWNSYYILNAFQKYHEKIARKCSTKAILKIAGKLKDVLSYKQQEHFVNVEVNDDVYQIKVSRVPKKKEAKEKIAFKENQYKCDLKQFSESQLKDIEREINLLALSNTVPKIEIKNFSYLAKDKKEFVSEIKSNLPNKINWTESNDLDKNLSGLFEGLYSDYSYIRFKSLATGGSKHESEAEEALIIILRDILLSKCRIKPKEGKEILKAFLSEQYQFPVFRRFVLLCIDKYWDENYKEMLNQFFVVVPNVLDETAYEVELFDLLKSHNHDFDSTFVKKLKELIKDVPQYYIEKGEKLTAYWEYKWLAALKKHEDFKDAYKEAKEKAEPKDGKDYEPDRETIKGGLVIHASSVSKEELLQKPIPETVKYLEEFKGADFWESRFEGKPSKEGLADTLQSAVKEDPRKFTDELELFEQTDQFYLVRILRGLKAAWNEGKEIDWKKIFDFCITYFGKDKEIIVNESKIAQGEDSGDGKYIRIVENIVDLIADGSKDDKRAFDPKYFVKAEKIFDLVLPLLKGEEHPDIQGDAVNYSLNSTPGRTVMAYVSFSLRVARASGKKEPDWGKNKFERFFEKGIETTIWFGNYLPQMNYLDGSYTKEKINDFANKLKDDYEWRMFMEGYLYGGKLYENIYHLMRENYIKTIESAVFEGRGDERLAEHISLGYLYYGEALKEMNADGKPSLFRKMLNEAKLLNKPNRWLKVAGFFWSVSGRKREKEDEEELLPEDDAKKKILDFWQWTYDKQDFVKDQLGESYLDFLGELSKLTILLDKIEEKDKERLLLTAPHIDRRHNSTFFIESLEMFKDDESVKRMGEIFLKALENSTPTFRQEEIQILVERIYKLAEKYSDAELKAELKKDADDICNTYGRRGVHFLKELFNRYN